VFSKDGKNFVNTILRLAKERDELKIVNDQFGGPTNAKSIAEVLIKLATEHKEQWGLYHYSGLPFVSWFEFAITIVKKKQKVLLNKNIKMKATTTSKHETIAKRPENSKMSSEKINTTFDIKDHEWEIFL